MRDDQYMPAGGRGQEAGQTQHGYNVRHEEGAVRDIYSAASRTVRGNSGLIDAVEQRWILVPYAAYEDPRRERFCKHTLSRSYPSLGRSSNEHLTVKEHKKHTSRPCREVERES